MEISGDQDQIVGTPELAPIGKRIEMLRIERGLSKQQLAKAAGVSRQQLWRVLAGKSELTGALRDRLAFVLRTDAAALQPPGGESDGPTVSLAAWVGEGTASAARPATVGLSLPGATATFAEFVASAGHVRAMLAAMPPCDAGLALKRAVLDAIEDVAMTRGITLTAEFFELRRAVITRVL